jgi:hypothetical protein
VNFIQRIQHFMAPMQARQLAVVQLENALREQLDAEHQLEAAKWAVAVLKDRCARLKARVQEDSQ